MSAVGRETSHNLPKTFITLISLQIPLDGESACLRNASPKRLDDTWLHLKECKENEFCFLSAA